ncbi:hypothetical protein FACUT_10350 [Fusarium acutatum]|uniref:F-box domain-containing protein n=1 Tax=Fusarium acutatum TaxID=78861 RepID=A0A8H4JIC6_9HYPO|nr:hypothetical protein FACUT_10350 [Fusarium acutatum]
MVESSYITTSQLSRFENLPPELTNTIINLLPPDSLASIRLCWPHLDGLILSRQFKTIRVTFAETDIERLQAVSSTYPYCAQELVFTTAQSHYRRKFLACVDSLPNLHTFTSELGPISGSATKEYIDGLVCQDPVNYMRWFLSKVKATWGPPGEVIKVIPRICTKDVCTCWQSSPQLSRLSSCTALPPGRPTGYIPRSSGSGGLPCEDSRHLICRLTPQAVAGIALNNSVIDLFTSLRELSTYKSCLSDGDALIKLDLPVVLLFTPVGSWSIFFRGRWKNLKTIKLTFVQFTFSANLFKTFIRRHASTLRHIMLHNCRSDPEVSRIIKFAASCPDVRLHRFAVFPAHESHARVELLDESYPDEEQVVVEKPRIVPESAVLSYINSKDPQHLDPFAAWKPLEYEYWGTVEQKAESTAIKWPQNNGMAVKCKQCRD